MGVTIKIDARAVDENIRRRAAAMPSLAKLAMNDVGAFISSEAKDRSPIDEGHLTGDIINKTETVPSGAAAVIFVPVNAASASYAVRMHEGLYELGPGSLAKQGRTGKTVGRKFIVRAIDDNRDRIVRIIKEKFKV